MPHVVIEDIMGLYLMCFGLEGVPGRVLGWLVARRPVSRLRADAVRANPPGA